MQIFIVILLKAIEIYSYVLLAYVLMSWIPGLYETWFGKLVIWLVKPVLQPFYKLNLQFVGMDWTVFVVMIAMNLLSRFLIHLFYLAS
ncbi:YggT family protein [Streptococcus gallinaceus]|uniref:YggT family protein n=1 Tax=Streptococcus gallinaceus TaxID=165758 RepID=A0ABV2JHN4_9STRE|nr:YggT family protein [Streptococcus gallinaceus]MCP1640144.1 YggT family protein [Streptococcus gallinaceus]MCP1770926.1 YggT family protein [Streptococcus gallinaceus]